LEHLAEQQQLQQQLQAQQQQQAQQLQQQQQHPLAPPPPDPLSGGLFAFGEALFPAGRGPGTILPPRDAGGTYNPFA
jgi:hypothetical protein